MLKISKSLVAMSVAGVLALAVAPAAMAEKGDWIIKGGATMVDPKSDNLNLGDIEVEDEIGNVIAVLEDAKINVDDATSFGFTVTYMMTDNLGVELLAAYPFNHDIKVCATVEGTRGCPQLAETDHLPPTLSLQYRFMVDSPFQPYVGAGINYTMFSDESFTGDLEEALELTEASLKLDDSTGFALQIGADWFFNDRWLINGDIRYIDLQSDLEICDDVGCEGVGEVKIDPMVYSIMIGFKF